MYTIIKQTPQTSYTIRTGLHRKAALAILDNIKDAGLKSGEDVNYSSFMGKDIRLTVSDDIIYILRKE